MLYVTLKAIHLLAVVVWVGGMFFMLACLRPAADAVLEPPARLRLMHASMRRFFDIVIGAVAIVVVSGVSMIAMAGSTAAKAGLAFNMPLDWYVMVGGFIAMLAIFAHVRIVLFDRLGRAVADEAWPRGAAAAGAIRIEVMLNLVIGAFIIVVMELGGTV